MLEVQADGLLLHTWNSNAWSELRISIPSGSPYDQRMTMSARTSIKSNIEANGITNPVNAESSVSMIVAIQQFSRLQIEATEPFLQLQPKTDHNFQFKVYNQGNEMDKFKVGVTDATLNKLEEAGFQISMPIVSAEINSMDQPFNVRVMVRTPKNQDGQMSTTPGILC